MTIKPRAEKQLKLSFHDLISDVEKLFEESAIHKGGGPETTALANLVAVAQTVSCLKQLELHIQYQAAREPKKWQEGHRFAANLLKRIGESGIVAQKADQARKQLGSDDASSPEALRTWLAVQYLGFVRRKYLFLAKLGKEVS